MSPTRHLTRAALLSVLSTGLLLGQPTSAPTPVAGSATQPGKMLERRANAAVVKTIYRGSHQGSDERGLSAERAVADHGIGRVRSEVGNRGEIELDAEPMKPRCGGGNRVTYALGSSTAKLHL